MKTLSTTLAVGLTLVAGAPDLRAAAPDLRVTVESLAPIPGDADFLHQLPDGSLMMPDDSSTVRSTDRGKSWERLPALPGRLVVLRDGSLLALDVHTRAAGPGRLVLRTLRLKNLAALRALRAPRWQDAPLEFTGWVPMTADNAKEEVTTPLLYGPALELADGTLIASSYGNFAGDTVPMEGFVPARGEKWFKYRTYLLASRDGGRSWQYLSTVAYDGKAGQESYCEPGVVELGKGELLAVLRTGRFAPMYQARSVDGGRTWSRPESLHVLGLFPQLALLSNGVLVCSFGWRPTKNQQVGAGAPAALALQDYLRRYRDEVGLADPSAAAGDYVMFSVDQGRTWTKPRQIAGALTRGYTALAPAGPDTCLVVTRRVVIPGQSEASVLQKWMEDWSRWGRHSRIVLEARRITVAR